MEKATLKLYDPTPSGGSPGGERGSIPFQFNPKEVTIQKAAKWERKTAKGAKKAGPAGVQRLRALQADPGDVLRRLRQAGRQRRRGRREAVQLHRADRGERRPEEAEPTAGRPALGRDRQLPGFRHLGQRQVHALHLRRPADPGAVQRRARGDAQRALAAEPHVRQRLGPPLAHHGRGRLAGLGRLRGVRRPRRVAGTSPGSTGSTTRCAARPAPACCCRPPRSCEPCRSPTRSSSRSTARRCRRTSRRCSPRRYVDDSQQLPRPVRAALPRPRAPGAPEVRSQGRVRGEDLGVDQRRARRPSR